MILYSRAKTFSYIFAVSIIKELQKYAPGEILYVPSNKARKKWGTGTGARHLYDQRNEEIIYKYRHFKMPIETLCKEYNLSDETIRKILKLATQTMDKPIIRIVLIFFRKRM